MRRATRWKRSLRVRPYNGGVFTGLIQHTGKLAAREGGVLTVEAPHELLAGLREGDSVAVNGVCLTALRLSDGAFQADLLLATLRDTTLGGLPMGSRLNLEPALRAGDPLGGHIVQGHVDGTTELLRSGEGWPSQTAPEGAGSNPRPRSAGESPAPLLLFALPNWLKPWIVPKGSICVDGVSLTVQELTADSFAVELIPETLARTNLGDLRPGQRVNLEADLIVKTVSRLVAQHLPQLAGNQEQN